jgi:hypothetical protein
MTLADFKKITKFVKLNDSGNFNMELFIENVYETVLREPFTLEEDEDARMKLQAATITNKKLLFDKEREGILRRVTSILK